MNGTVPTCCDQTEVTNPVAKPPKNTTNRLCLTASERWHPVTRKVSVTTNLSAFQAGPSKPSYQMPSFEGGDSRPTWYRISFLVQTLLGGKGGRRPNYAGYPAVLPALKISQEAASRNFLPAISQWGHTLCLTFLLPTEKPDPEPKCPSSDQQMELPRGPTNQLSFFQHTRGSPQGS